MFRKTFLLSLIKVFFFLLFKLNDFDFQHNYFYFFTILLYLF